MLSSPQNVTSLTFIDLFLWMDEYRRTMFFQMCWNALLCASLYLHQLLLSKNVLGEQNSIVVLL